MALPNYEPPYTYDPRIDRYRDARGRFVSREAVRQAMNDVLDTLAVRVRDMAADLREGRISLVEWQRQMETHIKNAHLTSAAVAAGGWERMTQADYGRVGAIVREEYRYLREFVRAIENGLPLDGNIGRRSVLYMRQGHTTFYTFTQLRQMLIGKTQKRNRMTQAEHCSGCIDMTQKGWVDINDPTYVPIGSRECLSQCRCFEEYR
jgi:hypothetical protein